MAVSLATQFTAPTEVADSSTLSEIFAFRAHVWRATLAARRVTFLPDRWHDDDDAISRHWIIRDGTGRIAAAARLSIHPSLHQVAEADEYLRYGLDIEGPIAAPARVVVCPTAQGHGLGKTLLEIQDAAALQAGARAAVRQSSPDMCRLLIRRGWRIVGPANPDPRFPGVEFQVAVHEFVEVVGKQVA